LDFIPFRTMGEYYYQELHDDEQAVLLGFQSDDGNHLKARISLAYGANLCRFSFNDYKIIDYVPALLKISDFTGTPVLYPTPNRVKNGVFEYNGRFYDQLKHGRRIFEHGLVYDEPWELVQVSADDDRAILITKINWDRKSPLYDAFPFTHTLTLTYALFDRTIEMMYKILNNGPVEIPYGFGLHPYFQKLSGDQETSIKVPVTHVMEATEELLPTGKMIPIHSANIDIDKMSPVGDYDLDHVFLRALDGGPAVIQYLKQNFKLEITSTNDFSYFVVYSPKKTPYFCIEEQTCSTNAHNLYNLGFHKESGLKFVGSGETKTGKVRYAIKPLMK